MESNCAMFKASIVKASARSCGQKVIICRGINLETRWWTLVVKEAVKLKKKASKAWLSQGSPKAADRYQEAREAEVSAAAEVKIRVWEEFRETLEKDFWLTLRKFWLFNV